MNFKNIMLGVQARQKQLNLQEISRIGKPTGTESRLVIARDWGEGRTGSDCLMSLL
jgi:hypothetical protein